MATAGGTVNISAVAKITYPHTLNYEAKMSMLRKIFEGGYTTGYLPSSNRKAPQGNFYLGVRDERLFFGIPAS
jgi:hypothetical protein